MDLEQNSKDVGLHVVNHMIYMPHGTKILKQRDFCYCHRVVKISSVQLHYPS